MPATSGPWRGSSCPRERAGGHLLQPRGLRCGGRGAAAAARVRGALPGGRAGSLEGPWACPRVARAYPYRPPGEAETRGEAALGALGLPAPERALAPPRGG